MPLYLAIDAGGTKTTCLLADEQRILARASTGTVKLMRVSEEEATIRLQAMLEEVATSVDLSLDNITRTCFGLAGVSSPAARTWARQILPAIVSGEFLLCGDEEIALDAAFRGGPGILVIAGTGSNIVGRDAAGALHTAGGWGPVLGDEGSGHWIGLEALRAALRDHDRAPLGTPPSPLLAEIQSFWQLASLPELVAFGNQRSGLRRPAPDFSTLAPVVALCAAGGDPLAARILERAGEELAGQVALVAQKMSGPQEIAASSGSPSKDLHFPTMTALSPTQPGNPHDPGTGAIGVAFTGSVLAHIAPVRTAMAACLAVSLPKAKVLASPIDPLEGALWRARHA